MDGYLVYKCRNCKKEFKSLKHKDIDDLLNQILDPVYCEIKGLENLSEFKYSFHLCGLGIQGIGDLIRVQESDEEILEKA